MYRNFNIKIPMLKYHELLKLLKFIWQQARCFLPLASFYPRSIGNMNISLPFLYRMLADSLVLIRSGTDRQPTRFAHSVDNTSPLPLPPNNGQQHTNTNTACVFSRCYLYKCDVGSYLL